MNTTTYNRMCICGQFFMESLDVSRFGLKAFFRKRPFANFLRRVLRHPLPGISHFLCLVSLVPEAGKLFTFFLLRFFNDHAIFNKNNLCTFRYETRAT